MQRTISNAPDARVMRIWHRMTMPLVHGFCGAYPSLPRQISRFGLFLGPLRRLLFFRRQGGFLLIFPLIFDFFGHGVRSQEVWGVFCESKPGDTARWGRLSSGILV